ncbi:hypothetical protein DVG78_29010 [Runella aurantiaca]|uniref:Uncharacterized protein n=1 Tax=Runella aurantiaca TaxID=2282308 RepID=A0A369HXY1_9BACT|nr:hypothetical protein DVG78_29010 [Runella aurantiaca]
MNHFHRNLQKAKERESPFFKITTQTPTFTKCDDEPFSRHFTEQYILYINDLYFGGFMYTLTLVGIGLIFYAAVQFFS